MAERFYASDDSPGPLDLVDEPEPEVCPFCDNEVCTDEAACEEAAQDHWTDQEIMYMRGK